MKLLAITLTMLGTIFGFVSSFVIVWGVFSAGVSGLKLATDKCETKWVIDKYVISNFFCKEK